MGHEPFDVLIVGGGVAGAAACIAFAREAAPLRNIWVATASTPADRVGETLSAGGVAVLEELGLSEIAHSPLHREANAFFSAWGSERLVERNAFASLDGAGLVLNRSEFENQLCAHALNSPIEHRSTTVMSAQREDGFWTVVLEDGSQLQSRFVLDCTGRAAVVARNFAQRKQLDQLAAAHAILPQVDESVEPTAATMTEAARDGWWYASLLPDGRLVVTYFSDPDLMPKNLSRDVDVWQDLISQSVYIQRWIEDAGFEVSTPPSLASAATSWVTPVAGEGWAAAGDAAASFDPLSSHGLTTALRAASRVAPAIVGALADQPAALMDYVARVEGGVADFLAQRRAAYAREHRFSVREFWRRRQEGD